MADKTKLKQFEDRLSKYLVAGVFADDSARRKPAGSWWRCTLSRVRPLLASVAVGPREQGEIVLQNIMQVGKFETHERLGL